MPPPVTFAHQSLHSVAYSYTEECACTSPDALAPAADVRPSAAEARPAVGFVSTESTREPSITTSASSSARGC